MNTTTYTTSFADVCSSKQKHIVHERIFLVPFTAQTVTHIAYEAAQGCHDRMNTRHQASMRAQSMPIAVLLRRRAAKQAIGKCLV